MRKLFEISSEGLFSIFLIGHNWSHSVHFHFVVQLLQLFYFDLMLRKKRPFYTLVKALACNFIKTETPAQEFSCEFCKPFKNTLK